MSRTAISVKDLSKAYRLGVINHGVLYKDLQSWLARRRGKEDPNARVDDNAISNSGGEHFWALKNITVDIPKGEIFGIIGKNGAGKSTLLKILSKITAPSSGVVKINGRIASLLEVGTGFHPELTGKENIFLNGAILGMTKREIIKKFDEIVAFSEIEKFIDTPVKRYSSGMYVRLAFAVAAHLEPEILVVDEVLAVGDAQFQKKCIGKMEDVTHKQGRTILFVSHNMHAVRSLCTKAIWLENGIIKKIGSTANIIDDYVLSAAFQHDSCDCTVYIHESDHVTGVNEMRINRVFLVNNLNKRFSVLWKQPIILDIDFELLCGVSDLSVGVGLLSLNDELLVSMHQNDDMTNSIWSIGKGSYRMRIIMPNRLHPGMYKIGIGAHHETNQKNIAHVVSPIIKIEDYDENMRSPMPYNHGIYHDTSIWEHPQKA